MGKSAKIWLLIGLILILLGGMIFVGVMTMLGWKFEKLNTAKMETNTYHIQEQFHNINLKIDTADVTFLPAAEGGCQVVCLEESTAKRGVSVENGTLQIEFYGKEGLQALANQVAAQE